MAKMTKLERGQEICTDLLESTITDFEQYAESILHKDQTIAAAYRLIGDAVYEYFCSIDDSREKVQIVDKIFATKNYTKVTVFRVAQHIATKYDLYEENKKKKKSYLAMHPDVKDVQYDIALRFAGFSTLAKKFSDIKFAPSEYSAVVQNT